MKASKFTDAQKASIIRQGEDGTPVRRRPARPFDRAFRWRDNGSWVPDC